MFPEKLPIVSLRYALVQLLSYGSGNLEIIFLCKPIFVSAPGATNIPLDKIRGLLALSPTTIIAPQLRVIPFLT